MEPLRALSNAGNASGANRAEGVVTLIAHYLQAADGSTSGGADAYHFVCHDDGAQRVITAWALSPRDKAGLVLNFLHVLDKLNKESVDTDLLAKLTWFDARRDAASPAAIATVEELRETVREKAAIEQELEQRSAVQAGAAADNPTANPVDTARLQSRAQYRAPEHQLQQRRDDLAKHAADLHKNIRAAPKRPARPDK